MIPIRYRNTVKGRIRFSGNYFDPGAAGGALWPWVTRHTSAVATMGVNLEGDVVQTGTGFAPVTMEKTDEAAAYQQYVSWRDSGGTITGRIYVPPVYP